MNTTRSEVRWTIYSSLPTTPTAYAYALPRWSFSVPESQQLDTLTLHLDNTYMLGIEWANPVADGSYKTVTKHFTLFESIPAGINHGWNVLTGYVDDLKYLFTADGAKSVGSFGAIGSLFPNQWDWCKFWELTAFISLMLAFMNILPIPGT